MTRFVFGDYSLIGRMSDIWDNKVCNIAKATEVPIQMLAPTMPFPDSFRMSGRRTKAAAKFLDNVVLYRKFMSFTRTSCFLLGFFLGDGLFS